MGLADDSKLPLGEGDGPLATATGMGAIPEFSLKPFDCARLQEILNEYAPYKAGQTAVFWHVVGVIGSHRKPPDPEQELRDFGSSNDGEVK